MAFSTETVDCLRTLFRNRVFHHTAGTVDIDRVLDQLTPDDCSRECFRQALTPILNAPSVNDAVTVVDFRSGANSYQLRFLNRDESFVLTCAETAPEAAGSGTEQARQRLESLSDRERQVLRLLVRGLSNKQVAAALFLSPRTIEKHRASVYRKTGVNSMAVLARVWMDSGYADEPDNDSDRAVG